MCFHVCKIVSEKRYTSSSPSFKIWIKMRANMREYFSFKNYIVYILKKIHKYIEYFWFRCEYFVSTAVDHVGSTFDCVLNVFKQKTINKIIIFFSFSLVVFSMLNQPYVYFDTNWLFPAFWLQHTHTHRPHILIGSFLLRILYFWLIFFFGSVSFFR